MKKWIIALIVISAFQIEVQGQDTIYVVKEVTKDIKLLKKERRLTSKRTIPERRNEISLGAGWAPYFLNYGYQPDRYFGSYTFKYARHINERYTTGLSFSYLRTPSFFYGDFIDEDISVKNKGRQFYVYMGDFNLNYFNRNKLTLYMGGSIGLVTVVRRRDLYDTSTGVRTKEKDGFTAPIADLTIFGIRMRDAAVSPYFEVGLGLGGFFRGGVNFRF